MGYPEVTASRRAALSVVVHTIYAYRRRRGSPHHLSRLKGKRAVTKIVPEKTIEIWTAFSLVNHFGPSTRIWSWPTGADQIVAAADLRKWFMLELKAPEEANTPYITIDLAQLSRYLGGYQERIHPDVLYVLPGGVRGPVPRTFISAPADPRFQRWFCHNSYVIRATQLATVLNGPLASSPRAKSARIRSTSGCVEYQRRWNSPLTSKSVPTLHDTLRHMRDCSEPLGMSLRSRATLEGPPTREDELWLLSLERIQRAVQAVAEGRPGRLLLVGH